MDKILGHCNYIIVWYFRGILHVRFSPHMQATELFIVHLAKQSYGHTVKGKRKTIQRRDLDACIPQEDSLAFLEGAVD